MRLPYLCMPSWSITTRSMCGQGFGRSFVPQAVELGLASETRVSVKEGLQEGELIAVNAQDLISALLPDS